MKIRILPFLLSILLLIPGLSIADEEKDGEVYEILDENKETLEQSGAKIRDKKLYGLYYKGADTVTRLYDFAKLRIFKLDEFYK